MIRSDPFHKEILESYMAFFNFTGTMDSAMRTLCSKLKLSGETQVIDRVLYAFSKQYWECNPHLQSLFQTQGEYS